ALSAHPHAMFWLAVVAFAESSVFPIPPDVMIIPMILAARQNAWKIAGISTIASVAGGLAGYALGFFLWDVVGQPLIDFYGYAEKFGEFREGFGEYGALAVFVFGLTPFPYKVITLTSGFVQLDLLAFVVASVLSRGLRFYLEAALLWKFGEPIRTFIEKRLELLSLVFAVLLVLGFVAIRYL
ncbi:MAG: YqaA family protein, partial [Alphaproteobacteria bacterium]|nr:YqaA family protein [Alphaproteobacteria bacterium]